MGSFVDTARHISHRAFHELYGLCSHEREQKIISDNANRWDGIKAAHAAAALFCFGVTFCPKTNKETAQSVVFLSSSSSS